MPRRRRQGIQDWPTTDRRSGADSRPLPHHLRRAIRDEDDSFLFIPPPGWKQEETKTTERPQSALRDKLKHRYHPE